MASIEQMIDGLIGREGSYANHASDKGGETMWGITAAVARKCGYQGRMIDMPRAVAATIYRKQYFIDPGYDKVYALSQRIAEELFDTGVNMGTSLPGPWLQRVLNVLNRQGADYADIAVDGQIGPGTVGALRSYLNKRGADGEKIILRLLNCLQGARYIEITEAREKNEDFANGWALNRLELA